MARLSDIDNELVGDPVVECEETMVSLTFKTKKPFNGKEKHKYRTPYKIRMMTV